MTHAPEGRNNDAQSNENQLHVFLGDLFGADELRALEMVHDLVQGRALRERRHERFQDNLHCSQILTVHKSTISFQLTCDIFTGCFDARVEYSYKLVRFR